MGNSTGSMFYLFVIVIVLYIVGASIYQAFLWFRKWQEKKRDEKFLLVATLFSSFAHKPSK